MLIKPYTPWPILLIEEGEEKNIILSDIHLGYELELVKSGINIPPQTERFKETLLKVIEEIKPYRLIILGDLKHVIPTISSKELVDVSSFLREFEKSVETILLIPGNHDGKISYLSSPKIAISSARGTTIGKKEKIGLFHGHTWPTPKLFEAKLWIMGHNHPTIQFKGAFGFKISKTVWIKAPIDVERLVSSFLRHRGITIEKNQLPSQLLAERYNVHAKCSELIIVPAFNDLLGGVPFNIKSKDELLGPVIRSNGVLLDKAEIFLLDGTYLGTIRELEKVS
ncbi:MAG: metallophosphoesterase [Candidatus Bathyarchaeota archaeon]